MVGQKLYMEKSLKFFNKSFLRYSGNKYKLLPQLEPLFPKNINTFYDVFGGSATMCLNTKAQQFHYNEYDKTIFNIVKLLYETDTTKLFDYIDKQSSEFDIKSAENFMKFRSYINNNKNDLSDFEYFANLYLIHFYSFSNIIRLNSEGFINIPFGNRVYNFEKKQSAKDSIKILKSLDLKLTNKSFVDLDFTKLSTKDFIYLDPPYLITGALYNKTWSTDLENSLLTLLQKLLETDVKFGLSNVTHHNEDTNNLLIAFIESNKQNLSVNNIKTVYTLSRAKTISTEVYVTNVKPSKKTFNLF